MWVANKIYYRGNSSYIKAYHGENVIWEKELGPDYLTFTCVEPGGISLTNYGGNTPNIEYLKNGGEWITWDYTNINMVVGDVVKMRGHNESGFSSSHTKHSKFIITTGRIAASGNIMSLIDSQIDGTKTIPNEGCFILLFSGATGLIKAPNLPATTLRGGYENGCYQFMFNCCSNLTGKVVLPATTLAMDCYNNMFSGCSKLNGAEILFNDRHSVRGFRFMFKDCSNLNYIKILLLNSNNYTDVFYDWTMGVAANGTFVKFSQNNNWPRGTHGIPNGWTVINA